MWSLILEFNLKRIIQLIKKVISLPQSNRWSSKILDTTKVFVIKRFDKGLTTVWSGRGREIVLDEKQEEEWEEEEIVFLRAAIYRERRAEARALEGKN